MNQQCKVCGEPAAGFHFGAFTCEGCKVSSKARHFGKIFSDRTREKSRKWNSRSLEEGNDPNNGLSHVCLSCLSACLSVSQDNEQFLWKSICRQLIAAGWKIRFSSKTFFWSSSPAYFCLSLPVGMVFKSRDGLRSSAFPISFSETTGLRNRPQGVPEAVTEDETVDNVTQSDLM